MICLVIRGINTFGGILDVLDLGALTLVTLQKELCIPCEMYPKDFSVLSIFFRLGPSFPRPADRTLPSGAVSATLRMV